MFEFFDAVNEAIMEYAHAYMGSFWIYLLILGIALLDAFFPVVPSETMVISAGVIAASTGQPNVVLVMVFAALGAFIGDHVSYTIGRVVGRPLLEKAHPDSRRRKAFDWAHQMLEERGGLVLVVARYIPGGRTAITLTTGMAHYPLKLFSFFDAIAAVSWGVYSGLIGFIGGRAFESKPLYGLMLGLGIAVAVTVIVEVVRHLRKKAATGDPQEAEKSPQA